ncbi:hypothetical protein SAMN03159507_01676 [Pseudomonas sp. NFACC32-1]|uniref:hypothetical protein n=1 Tax=Pseudomonas TaxID=286 RepID=UPI000876065F|nr:MULTISPECIES: hypothetical protein [Pseudomonas]MDT8907390.1 hypothetical protein [Pseudomonas prosekii]NHN70072.1 hypothetical protein [Pseudomonas fluorescens]ROO38199.1 hypothetical protein BIV09_14310 [Pseudomonas sp. 7SR1]ROO41161.1 hypothetical protein BIV08_15475 [Pseudomonas sp. AF76]SCX54981.1 hypothetical protein SAMN03159507_01676 [Pseudomonas sp. NFACC32-1]
MKTSRQLEKPYFSHATEGVVDVPKLPDPAKAEVRQYENHRAGDEVRFTVTTSTGNTWTDSVALTADQRFPLGFAIPKSTFEKGLTAGATAKMQYTVINYNTGNPTRSEILELSLVL